MRGLQRRGKIYWYAKMVNGARTRVSLGTEDQGEAVAKVLAMRQEPELLPINSYEHEMAAYIKLHTFLGWLADRDKLRENVALKLELDDYKHTARLVFCDMPTVADLIVNAPDDTMRFILYCGFHAGMRKLEIIEARPEWFDLNAGAVTVQATAMFQTKDKDHRTVPLTSGFKVFGAKYGLLSPFMLMSRVPKGQYKYRYDFRKPFEEYVKRYAAGHRLGKRELAPAKGVRGFPFEIKLLAEYRLIAVVLRTDIEKDPAENEPYLERIFITLREEDPAPGKPARKRHKP